RHISIHTEATADEAVTEKIQDYLEEFLHQHFPATRNLEVTHRWAGILGFPTDDLPTVGPIPGTVHTYGAVGFHGHGLNVVCAKMAAELMLDGKSEHPAKLFSPHRHI
ncbi:MAG: NAD(P)/FAD-dependent oxidoreductase, partial [Planctomycetota bacterium]